MSNAIPDPLNKLRRSASAAGRDANLTDDLLGEAMLRSIKRFDVTASKDEVVALNSEGEAVSLSGYIRKASRTILIDQARRKKLRDTKVQDHLVEAARRRSGTNDPSSLVLRRELQGRVRQAISRLKRRERLVIWLSDYEGMKAKDIAIHLDCTADNVRTLRGRSRKKLKSLLDSEMNAAEELL